MKEYNVFEREFGGDHHKCVGTVLLDDEGVKDFLDKYGFKDEDGYLSDIYYDVEEVNHTTVDELISAGEINPMGNKWYE